jgi:hypothetical protein
MKDIKYNQREKKKIICEEDKKNKKIRKMEGKK